jgi:hypothetical protein
MYGVLSLGVGAVRERINPWTLVGPSAVGRWPTLHRWVDAAMAVRLFGRIRASPSEWTRRQRAQRVAMSLVEQSPPTAVHCTCRRTVV